MAIIEAVVIRAGEPDGAGIVYPDDVLRKLADGKVLFWDRARRAIVYRGPGVRGCTMGKPVVAP